MSGAYRKILLKPTDLIWEKIPYSNPNQDLVQPDEDVLLGFAPPERDIEEGDKLALKIEFSLGTAAYATMALREVLKSETGNVQQRAMTEKMMDRHNAALEEEEGGAVVKEEGAPAEVKEKAADLKEAEMEVEEEAKADGDGTGETAA